MDLAKLVVRLEAQSAQLLAELDKANSRISKFERNATGSLDKLNRRFDKFGFGIKSALAAFATGFSISKIVEASSEAAESFANLENAVLLAGDAAGGRSARDFSDAAQRMANLTTQTDDAVMSVQQLLLRFQNIRTDRFDEATKRVLDLSIALKKDLNSAATLVGKALADPEKGMAALAKAGVLFSDSQKEVIKNLVEQGKLGKAQGLILDELAKKYGGAAEAARNSFGGALTAVKNSLGELMEANGGLPGATKSLNELAEILQSPAVRDGADALFSTIIRGASAAANFVGQIAAGLSILTTGRGSNKSVNIDMQIEDLQEEMADRLGRVGEGPVAELARGAIRAQFQERIDDLLKMQDELFQIGVAGAEATKRMQAQAEAAAEAAKASLDAGGAVSDAARKKLEDAGKALTERVRTPMEELAATIKMADELLAAQVITLETWTRAVQESATAVDPLLGAMVRMNEGAADLSAEMEAATDEFNKEQADSIGDYILASADDLVADVEKALEKTDQEINKFAEQATRNVQDILADGISTGLRDGFDEGLDGMLDAFVRMIDQMVAQAIAADIGKKLFGGDGLGGSDQGWLDKIFGGMMGKGSSSSAPAAGIVQGEHSWWDKVFGGLGTILGGWMDEGGRGKAGVAYAIGTRAQPEVFVPDQDGEFIPAHKMGGGGNLTQNIYPTGPITARTAKQLQREAALEQGHAQRRYG